MYNDERAGVGTHSRRASVEVKRKFFSDVMMNWTLARPDCIPTPARGNEKKNLCLFPKLKLWTPIKKISKKIHYVKLLSLRFTRT
jgi:hypothetical protein